MENIIMLILGVFISVVGIVNIKGNISTIHSYNRRRVKEEDIPKYGKVVGTGTLIIGISLVLGFIVSFWSEEIMGYIILPAIIIGLGLILYGQFKYNNSLRFKYSFSSFRFLFSFWISSNVFDSATTADCICRYNSL